MIKLFKGLNNVSDPLGLDMSWLVQADNLNVTDRGVLNKRAGYTLARAGSFIGAFSTFDFERGYCVTPSAIQTFPGEDIAPLTSPDTMFWTEINSQVFFNNGTDSGIIRADNSVLPWRWSMPASPVLGAVTGDLPAGTYMVCCTYTLPDGRETGATEPAYITLGEGQALQISQLSLGCNVYIAPANSDVFQLYCTAARTATVFNSSPDYLGRDLLNAFVDPLPLGAGAIQAWQGRIYAAHHDPALNQTAIWFSEPLGFHLFNLNSSFFLVPGKVEMLAPHDAALVVGTGECVYAYDGAKLTQVADYGVVPGQHWDKDGDRLLFWSKRGLCSALPFQNLTDRQISVAPGVRAGGCLVRAGGQKRYLTVLQQGGSPFNSR